MKAYAQDAGTVVNGSPVAGAVVCAQSLDGGLTPFVPCTNTDNNGKAVFFFTPTTRAGTHYAEIRGTVEMTNRLSLIQYAPQSFLKSPPRLQALMVMHWSFPELGLRSHN